MKKQFLTLALLATVAVGGAFAGNVHARLTTEAGPLNTEERCTFETIEDDCNPNTVTTPCTLSDGVTDAYTNAAGPEGKCTQQLFLTIP